MYTQKLMLTLFLFIALLTGWRIRNENPYRIL